MRSPLHRHRLRARADPRRQHVAAAARRAIAATASPCSLGRSILTEKVSRRGYHLSRDMPSIRWNPLRREVMRAEWLPSFRRACGSPMSRRVRSCSHHSRFRQGLFPVVEQDGSACRRRDSRRPSWSAPPMPVEPPITRRSRSRHHQRSVAAYSRLNPCGSSPTGWPGHRYHPPPGGRPLRYPTRLLALCRCAT